MNQREERDNKERASKREEEKGERRERERGERDRYRHTDRNAYMKMVHTYINTNVLVMSLMTKETSKKKH
jgi:hypothetical protein